MEILLQSPSKLGRSLKLNISSKAKQDSISFLFVKNFFLSFLESGNLKLFFYSKSYSCAFIGLKKSIGIFRKNKKFLQRKNSLSSYIFVFEKIFSMKNKEKNFQAKNVKNKKKFKLTFQIEKSLVYLMDRKKKSFFSK